MAAQVAVAPPANGVVDLAGPEALPIGEILRRHLAAAGDGRAVIDDPSARHFGAALDEKSLVPAGAPPPRLGRFTLDAWLAQAEDLP